MTTTDPPPVGCLTLGPGDVEVWIERGHAVGRAAGVVASLATGAHRPTSQLDPAGVLAADAAAPLETIEAIWMALAALANVEHGAAARLRVATTTIERDPAKPTADEDAIAALAKAIGRHLAPLMEQIKAAWPACSGDARASVAGVLWLDEALAAYLERFGVVGATAATDLREQSRGRMGGPFPEAPSRVFRLWRDPAQLGECKAITRKLGRVLWHAEVQPQIANRHALAIPRGVQREMHLVIVRSVTRVAETDDGARIVAADGVTLARYERGAVAPAIVAETLDRIRRGAELVRTATAERLLRFLIRRAHAPGRSAYEPIVFARGLDGLAREMGITTKRDVERLLPILEALQAYRGGRRELPAALTYRYGGVDADGQWHKRPCTGAPARLHVTLGEALVPLYTKQLAAGEARWLLPVLAAPSLPRDVGSDVHARLLVMQWEMLTEMRRRVSQIDAGWFLPEIVAPAADAVEVRRRDADRAVAHWTTAGDAWLLPVGASRVTLADDRALATFRDAVETRNRVRSSAIARHKRSKRK